MPNLPMLGVTPEMGRSFSADEDKAGGEGMVMLSHGVWQARFGGRAVLGERVLLDGRPSTIAWVVSAGTFLARCGWIPSLRSVPKKFPAST